MHEVDKATQYTLEMVVRKAPIHFLGPVYEAKLRHAYETGIDGVCLVFIDYGIYSLRGTVILQEPEMHLYLDFHSMVDMIEILIENAITEYDSNVYAHRRITGKGTEEDINNE
jgi:hypothetical protein